MDKLIFATGNEGKMKEVRMILADLGYEIQSMKEAGINVDIVEDGKTFEENALIKARAISKETRWCLPMIQAWRSTTWTRRLAYTARDSSARTHHTG